MFSSSSIRRGVTQQSFLRIGTTQQEHPNWSRTATTTSIRVDMSWYNFPEYADIVGILPIILLDNHSVLQLDLFRWPVLDSYIGRGYHFKLVRLHMWHQFITWLSKQPLHDYRVRMAEMLPVVTFISFPGLYCIGSCWCVLEALADTVCSGHSRRWVYCRHLGWRLLVIWKAWVGFYINKCLEKMNRLMVFQEILSG